MDSREGSQRFAMAGEQIAASCVTLLGVRLGKPGPRGRMIRMPCRKEAPRRFRGERPRSGARPASLWGRSSRLALTWQVRRGGSQLKVGVAFEAPPQIPARDRAVRTPALRHLFHLSWGGQFGEV